MNTKQSIHFISRAYPPVLGGIENQNKAVYENLCIHRSITATINRYGKKFLPLFLPYAILRSLFFTRSEITLLGDGVLAIIPWCVKLFKSNKKFVCIVHGLDITYSAKIYQSLWIKTFYPRVDHFVAVSHNTKVLLVSKGIDEKKVSVIPNGFDFSNIQYSPNKKELDSFLKTKTANKIVLLTLGRLVKRKGVKWFVEHVMQQLPQSFIYLIAGTGPDEPKIKQFIEANSLNQQIKLLGRVSEKEKQLLLSNSDLFIQPNIKVANDVEGFGISVIEASAYNLPVISSNIEGLKDAVQEGENGWLVESGNSDGFVEKITEFGAHPDKLTETAPRFREYSRAKFDWPVVINHYIKTLDGISHGDG